MKVPLLFTAALLLSAEAAAVEMSKRERCELERLYYCTAVGPQFGRLWQISLDNCPVYAIARDVNVEDFCTVETFLGTAAAGTWRSIPYTGDCFTEEDFEQGKLCGWEP